MPSETNHTCENFNPDVHGFCEHYDTEDYGDMGTAHFCCLNDRLVQYIPNCPMSSTKCEPSKEDS